MLFLVVGDDMLRIVGDEWLMDTEALPCSNNYTEIVVKIERRGVTYIGENKIFARHTLSPRQADGVLRARLHAPSGRPQKL